MVSFSDSAIVLQTYEFGEFDRLITFFGRNHGKFKAIAKGIRKTTAHQSGRVLLFNNLKVDILRGKNLNILRSAQTIQNLQQPLAANYELFVCGGAIVSSCNALNIDHKKNMFQFDLLAGSLSALQSVEFDPRLVVYIFLAQSLKIHGLLPEETLLSSPSVIDEITPENENDLLKKGEELRVHLEENFNKQLDFLRELERR